MWRINNWDDRQTGDIYVTAQDEALSRAIRAAELVINPQPSGRWLASHAGVVKDKNTVVEAWITLPYKSSAAMVNDSAKYDGEMESGRLRLYRPAGTPEAKAATLDKIIATLGPQPYGVLAIAGFVVELDEELFLHRAMDNPVKHAMVCSKTALTDLVWLGTEPWSANIG